MKQPAPTMHPMPPAARFLPAAEVGEYALDRMAALLFETSYLQYCSVGNKLGLPFAALQRRQNIDPYLAQITAMVDPEQHFLGFFNAAPMSDYTALHAVSHYRDEMKAMDHAYDGFIGEHCADSDFFVAGLAIEPRYRGLGLFHSMLDEIGRRALARQAGRIVLTVWEHSPAFAMYLNKGFVSRARFDYAYPLFFDRLHLLDYPLTTRQAAAWRAPHEER
ncbi:MAG: hypothetical protein V4754_11075 [Pseudomonadota bacterium]